MPSHAMERPSLAERLSEAARNVDLSHGIKRRGVVTRIGDSVALAAGLDDAGYEELVEIDGGAVGLAFDLRDEVTGVVLLRSPEGLAVGNGIDSTGRMPQTIAGMSVRGRVIDPLGNPLDGGPPPSGELVPLFRDAPAITDRSRVEIPLHTGVMAVDAAIPIGRGQRQLIIGDRNVGKTALALDIVGAQRGGDVVCVYVAIGLPLSRIHSIRSTLASEGCLGNVCIVAADASMTPGMRYIAAYAGASIAEWFRDRGGHALVVYDDLTKHADSYRELALLLDRSPGREAYPADIFYLHAEILERAAALKAELGGGTVTALPLVETTDGDISSYIPTNLISITDGQIYLDSARFDRNLRPAIDIARSVSRIGSVAQPPSLRAAARNLRILLARFESLEALTRVGLEMDPSMQTSIRRGRILRELLRQPQFTPRPVGDQVIALTLSASGVLDHVPVDRVARIVADVVGHVMAERPEVYAALRDGDGVDEGTIAFLVEMARGLVPD